MHNYVNRHLTVVHPLKCVTSTLKKTLQLEWTFYLLMLLHDSLLHAFLRFLVFHMNLIFGILAFFYQNFYHDEHLDYMI